MFLGHHYHLSLFMVISFQFWSPILLTSLLIWSFHLLLGLPFSLPLNGLHCIILFVSSDADPLFMCPCHLNVCALVCLITVCPSKNSSISQLFIPCTRLAPLLFVLQSFLLQFFQDVLFFLACCLRRICYYHSYCRSVYCQFRLSTDAYCFQNFVIS